MPEQTLDRTAQPGAAHAWVPTGAWDCHMHIYDNRFPVAYESQRRKEAFVPDYLQMRTRLGIERTVIVTPTCYGTDNRCSHDAMVKMGPATRGIALFDKVVPREELRRLHDAGFRGIRYNPIRNTILAPEMLEPVARQIAEFGWHVQMNIRSHDIPACEALIRKLPTQVVLDHIGRVPQPVKNLEQDLDPILRILSTGKVWVKLSGAYLDTKVGSPSFSDVGAVAKELIKRFPERLVWGSDWPHSTAKIPVNDDEILELFASWVPDAATRKRILVDNPATVYGF